MSIHEHEKALVNGQMVSTSRAINLTKTARSDPMKVKTFLQFPVAGVSIVNRSASYRIARKAGKALS